MLCVVLLAGISLVGDFSASADGTTPSIVFNEIQYHPSSGNEDDEFLELHNLSADPVDMSGWCFTNGITLCFNSGTTIAGDGYAVISPNASETLSVYGVTTIATYTGNLSNSGEKVKLVDANSATVDSVTYSDHSPWPATPDGNGPSLELKDGLLDNSDPTAWSASLVNGGTPGVINSVTNSNLPSVSNVTQPQNVHVGDDEIITATITNAITTNLIYKVGFNDDVTTPMFDDGNHGDGAANDGVFGATIPNQASQSLVRFKVQAANGNGTVSKPGTDETINYYGYVVDPQMTDGGVPVLQWFISDADYDALVNNPLQDDTFFPCVIAYGNQVFDNSKIRLKGNYSRTFNKKPYKVDLPDGYFLNIPGTSKYPLNEFHLNSDFANGAEYTRAIVAWKIFEYAGFITPNNEQIQVNRNGVFEGAYLLADKYGKDFDRVHPEFATQEYF